MCIRDRREKAAIVPLGGTLVAGLAHGTAAASVAASVARERGAAALVIAPPSPAGVAASNLCTARAVLDELGRRGVRCAAALLAVDGADAPFLRGAAAGRPAPASQ